MYKRLDEMCKELSFDKSVQKMFRHCFLNTLETTVKRIGDETFVITGDIPAMWLRDSSVQVSHYVRFAREDADVRELVAGLIRRQMSYIRTDPYANAFNETANGLGFNDITAHSDWVWERKYELDSLVYPLWLVCRYIEETGLRGVLDSGFYAALDTICTVVETEQRHAERSEYSFMREHADHPDSLPNGGRGKECGYTGMSWCAFRPSDDRCEYNYLIPSNIFAVSVFRKLKKYVSPEYAERLGRLEKTIQEGIEKFGTVEHPRYGKIYAYETDGLGHYNLMDDANVPSLLSLPYLEYCDADDAIYRNTRRFVLSRDNPYYFEGKDATGVGSPHTPEGYIWHIGLIMQALTSRDEEEISRLLHEILATSEEWGCMHESFDASAPGNFTRAWFAWANTLFAVLVMENLGRLSQLLLPRSESLLAADSANA